VDLAAERGDGLDPAGEPGSEAFERVALLDGGHVEVDEAVDHHHLLGVSR
jgi:hypothetical protein